jgi:hypothetical protein
MNMSTAILQQSDTAVSRRAEIIPSGKACGAEVRGVDLQGLDGESVAVLKAA